MSEFTNNNKHRQEKLIGYILGLLNNENGTILLEKHQIFETNFTPTDVLVALDTIMQKETDFESIKTASNKLFNILYKYFLDIEKPNYSKTPIIKALIQDNAGIKAFLLKTRPLNKQINKSQNPELIEKLKNNFAEMLRFSEHYIVMQNIIFPEIENKIGQHGCLKIKWSFHDDIIRNIKATINLLEKSEFDLALFNKISSKIFFNINTIIFREENILFPLIFEKFEPEVFSKMFEQLSEFELEYYKKTNINTTNKATTSENKTINKLIELSTGKLNIEQLELIFSFLPVDITYVDENDEVRFFSNPKHRVFPRTTSIIGRKVQNCHPHESVDIVNKIVAAFKNEEKDEASFWIKMGPKYVLIKYFAVRDNKNNYKGVLEVSQEISDIQKIKGQRKLLDW